MLIADDLDLFGPGAIDEPHALYGRLRATAPVHRVPGTDFHLVTSWDLVTEAVRRTEDFSSHLRAIMVRNEAGVPEPFPMDMGGAVAQVLATADGADHRLHRAIVRRAMAKRFRQLDAMVGELAADCWDRYAAEGRIDWAAAMADRLPPAVLGRLLGLPDAELGHLLTSAYESVELLSGVVEPGRLQHLVESTFGLADYLGTKLRAADPKKDEDGLIGALAAAVEAGEIDHDAAVMVLMQLVGAGAETTSGLIGTAARTLAERPDLQDRLRAEPHLLDPFLDECLRLDPPLRGHYRTVATDTQLGDVSLARGSHLLLLWSAANRDPDHYERPDELDLHRPDPRQHLGFGRGVHFCVGSPLARMEATAALRVLLDRTSAVRIARDVRPAWVPSIIVRRHAVLEMEYR